MQQWPKTRVTLLARLGNPHDREAWEEFVALYGPCIFNFARRRLPQEEDAADVLQEVLSAVLKGTYQRPKGRFQKWLLTIVLNENRRQHLFHAAANRVQSRTSPAHWNVFVQAALENRRGQEVAEALNFSVTNVYVIKSRILKEIKDEIDQLEEDA
jgi:DNA-directed RNA polymerase specialized sigma24 family protein